MEYTIGSVVFDDWVIEQIIGQGSYGSVYKIRKSEYGVTTYSALKVIKIPQSSADIRSALSEGMDNQTVTSYFQGIVDDIVHEIAIMSQVKGHPNIVSYEDHKIAVRENEIGWDILIRMELLTGLIDYQLSHPIGERDVLQIAVDISEALAFCERKGLIHRDIKPENIFVSEIGAFKIGDFGVAKTAEKAASTQSRKGTEIYMAPEVYMGRPYDQNVDIYSLGLVLYRYLNDNRLPFYPQAGIPIRPGDRENALLERMKGTPIPAPAHGSDGLCKIVLKACEYDPARRYRSAGEMLTDLKALTVPPAGGFTQPESNASQPQGSYARPERNASQPKSGYARPESNASQPGSGSAQRRPDPNAYYAGAGSYSEQEGTTGMFGSTGNPGSRKSSGKAAGVKRDIREDYDTTGMFGEPENNGSASRESYGSTNSGNTNHRAANSGATTNGNATHGAANSGTANSALLCDVRVSDFGSDHVLAGVEFQEKYERLAFQNGGGGYRPPKCSWGQFKNPDDSALSSEEKAEAKAVENSLPGFAVDAIREAMPHLGRKLKGFDRDDAVMTAVEARSSSPVRFARNEGLMGSIGGQTLEGFFPCGEGAGYAGGIMSAAVDGIKAAEAIIKNWKPADRND